MGFFHQPITTVAVESVQITYLTFMSFRNAMILFYFKLNNTPPMVQNADVNYGNY